MKKSLLIKLHIYAGLFTCFYLIAFGLSALKMNHNIAIEKKIITNQWDIQIRIDNSLPNKELAAEIRDKRNTRRIKLQPVPQSLKGQAGPIHVARMEGAGYMYVATLNAITTQTVGKFFEDVGITAHDTHFGCVDHGQIKPFIQ